MEHCRILPAVAIMLLFLTAQSMFADTPSANDSTEIYQEGIASWYAGEFQGELTANGEIFDTNTISAAHRELPFGTIVRVTNLTNNLQVDVRINDRGPYVDGRIIDLSMAAADAIDMIDQGIAPVTLQILYLPDTPESAYNRAGDSDYIKIQIGAFSTVERAIELYHQLEGLGLKPYAEITDSNLIRLSVRWIPYEMKDEITEVLAAYGFTDTLIKPDCIE